MNSARNSISLRVITLRRRPSDSGPGEFRRVHLVASVEAVCGFMNWSRVAAIRSEVEGLIHHGNVGAARVERLILVDEQVQVTVFLVA